MWDPDQPSKKKKALGSIAINRRGQLLLPDEMRYKIAVLANQYQILAGDGKGIRGPELVRLLLIIGITPNF